MNIWHDINKERINADNFIAVIEISKESKMKYNNQLEESIYSSSGVNGCLSDCARPIQNR